MNSPLPSSFLTTLLGWFCGLLLLTSACTQEQKARLQDALPDGLTKAGGPQPTLDSVYVARQMLAEPAFKDQLEWAKKFYKERDYRLGWFKNHEVVPQAAKLLEVINKAGDEGLNPKDYRIKDFDKLFAELKQEQGDSARRNALEKKIDVALSGTYFNWASDFYRGLVNPRQVKNVEWDVKRNKIKLHKALMTILKERDSTYPYYEFEPLHPEYDRLKKALADYRTIQRDGGWPTLPAGAKLRPNDTSPAVALLRRRLLAEPGTPTQDVTAPVQAVSAGGPGAAPAAQKYDPELVGAVKKFQQLSGLRPDGVVAGETLRMLNIPLDQRIDQIILNMERWRWIPKRLEKDYLLVNIPDYKLHVVEDGNDVLDMDVIVGKTLHETPVFSDKMEYVVLAPYWNVPFSIIDHEMRPRLAADPVGTLDRFDMEVVKGYGAKAVPIDPTTIDWANLTEKEWKYTLRRRPGPKNDLGNVKFIFPNSNDIYLHDTPHDELFSQTKRNFSHGCVRVSEPIKLATYLLRNKPGWDQTTILDTIARRKEKYITLPKKLPVYLVYFTAWVDKDGNLNFRDDIYGHDQSLAKEYFGS